MIIVIILIILIIIHIAVVRIWSKVPQGWAAAEYYSNRPPLIIVPTLHTPPPPPPPPSHPQPPSVFDLWVSPVSFPRNPFTIGRETRSRTKAKLRQGRKQNARVYYNVYNLKKIKIKNKILSCVRSLSFKSACACVCVSVSVCIREENNNI